MTRTHLPRALLPVLSMLCLTFLQGCSRENDDWRAAQGADTVAAYQQFSREHPASAHAPEADVRATQLLEDEDWRKAQEDDGLQAYQQFVSQHPESRWSQEARVRIETITLGNAVGNTPAGAASPESAPVVAVASPKPPRPAAPSTTTPPGPHPGAAVPTPAPKPAVVATAPASSPGEQPSTAYSSVPSPQSPRRARNGRPSPASTLPHFAGTHRA